MLVGSELGRTLLAELPTPDQWLVPTIVQLELMKWVSREISVDFAEQVIAFSRTCVLAPLDTETALAAAEVCSAYGLATADAIIYATSQAHGAELLTCDSHFANLADVLFVPKVIPRLQ